MTQCDENASDQVSKALFVEYFQNICSFTATEPHYSSWCGVRSIFPRPQHVFHKLKDYRGQFFDYSIVSQLMKMFRCTICWTDGWKHSCSSLTGNNNNAAVEETLKRSCERKHELLLLPLKPDLKCM